MVKLYQGNRKMHKKKTEKFPDIRGLDGDAAFLFVLAGVGEAHFSGLGLGNDTGLGHLFGAGGRKKAKASKKPESRWWKDFSLQTLTRESVSVDFPWSTWAMTDIFRMLVFFSIIWRTSVIVKFTWNRNHPVKHQFQHDFTSCGTLHFIDKKEFSLKVNFYKKSFVGKLKERDESWRKTERSGMEWVAHSSSSAT